MDIILYCIAEIVNVIDSVISLRSVSVGSGIAKCILYCIVFYRD